MLKPSMLYERTAVSAAVVNQQAHALDLDVPDPARACCKISASLSYLVPWPFDPASAAPSMRRLRPLHCSWTR
jgi:hypothetical protein